MAAMKRKSLYRDPYTGKFLPRNRSHAAAAHDDRVVGHVRLLVPHALGKCQFCKATLATFLDVQLHKCDLMMGFHKYQDKAVAED